MYAVRLRPLAAVLGALVSAAACSDSTAPNAELTADEARELAMQMGVHLSGRARDLSPSASTASDGGTSLNAIPASFSVSIDLSVPCPRQGTTRLTVTVTGVADEAAKSFIADVSGTTRPNDCGYLVHGKTFRTTGLLTFTAHAEVRNGVPVGTHTATVAGEFSWRTRDGRSGTCTVNYSASANYTTNVATVNGSVCGSTIQFTGPLSG